MYPVCSTVMSLLVVLANATPSIVARTPPAPTSITLPLAALRMNWLRLTPCGTSVTSVMRAPRCEFPAVTHYFEEKAGLDHPVVRSERRSGSLQPVISGLVEPCPDVAQPARRRPWRPLHGLRTGCGRGVATASAVALAVDHPLGDGERGVGRGNTGVDRGVEQDLTDLLGGETVAQRTPHMHLDLVLPPERGQRGERDHRTVTAVQAVALPDVPPGRAGDEVLEGLGERARAGERAIDVLVTEHLAADPHPGGVALCVVHRAQSPRCRCSAMRRLTASARSTLARCEAGSSSSNRARGIAAAIRSPCEAGIARSWAPAITSVGARTLPRPAVTS